MLTKYTELNDILEFKKLRITLLTFYHQYLPNTELVTCPGVQGLRYLNKLTFKKPFLFSCGKH